MHTISMHRCRFLNRKGAVGVGPVLVWVRTCRFHALCSMCGSTGSVVVSTRALDACMEPCQPNGGSSSEVNLAREGRRRGALHAVVSWVCSGMFRSAPNGAAQPSALRTRQTQQATCPTTPHDRHSETRCVNAPPPQTHLVWVLGCHKWVRKLTCRRAGLAERRHGCATHGGNQSNPAPRCPPPATHAARPGRVALLPVGYAHTTCGRDGSTRTAGVTGSATRQQSG